MKKSLIIASIFAATTFAASTTAFADETVQTAPVVDQASFQALDVNQDGVINVEEAGVNEILVNVFVELDQDQSNDLSVEEFKQFSSLIK